LYSQRAGRTRSHIDGQQTRPTNTHLLQQQLPHRFQRGVQAARLPHAGTHVQHDAEVLLRGGILKRGGVRGRYGERGRCRGVTVVEERWRVRTPGGNGRARPARRRSIVRVWGHLLQPRRTFGAAMAHAQGLRLSCVVLTRSVRTLLGTPHPTPQQPAAPARTCGRGARGRRTCGCRCAAPSLYWRVELAQGRVRLGAHAARRATRCGLRAGCVSDRPPNARTGHARRRDGVVQPVQGETGWW
jgi:hypothetical protein